MKREREALPQREQELLSEINIVSPVELLRHGENLSQEGGRGEYLELLKESNWRLGCPETLFSGYEKDEAGRFCSAMLSYPGTEIQDIFPHGRIIRAASGIIQYSRTASFCMGYTRKGEADVGMLKGVQQLPDRLFLLNLPFGGAIKNIDDHKLLIEKKNKEAETSVPSAYPESVRRAFARVTAQAIFGDPSYKLRHSPLSYHPVYQQSEEGDMIICSFFLPGVFYDRSGIMVPTEANDAFQTIGFHGGNDTYTKRTDLNYQIGVRKFYRVHQKIHNEFVEILDPTWEIHKQTRAVWYEATNEAVKRTPQNGPFTNEDPLIVKQMKELKLV